MKSALNKYLIVLPLAFSFMTTAKANRDIFYPAPFSHVEVKVASKIYVEYGFDSHSQTLICFSDQNNNAITSVEWTYKNATRKIPLPVSLKDDARFEGYFANPEGQLTISNEFASKANSGSIFVTCQYFSHRKI